MMTAIATITIYSQILHLLVMKKEAKSHLKGSALVCLKPIMMYLGFPVDHARDLFTILLLMVNYNLLHQPNGVEGVRQLVLLHVDEGVAELEVDGLEGDVHVVVRLLQKHLTDGSGKLLVISLLRCG